VDDELVWYAAYGSNLCAARLACYLEGGTPLGARRATPGARDPRPPRDWRRVDLPHPLWFGGPSRTWRGGPAFLDVERPGTAVGRAWLVTRGQLADVVAQENGRPAGSVDLPDPLVAGGGVVLPGAAYGRVVALAPVDGRPCLTATYHRRPDGRAPDPAYLALVAAGLAETGLGAESARSLLAAHPQVPRMDDPDVR
jgi:hypothetical protein